MSIKRITVFLLLLALIFLTQTAQVSAFSGSGEGTEESPFVIINVSQLEEIDDDNSAYYVLGKDIDASETTVWHDGKGFAPI